MESQHKDTVFSKNRTLRLGEKLVMLDSPLVMGILNLSTDSFYSPARPDREDKADWFLSVVEHMLPWCDIVDIGAVSTRPGSKPVAEEEEIKRIKFALPLITRAFPDISISVDTYRGRVAETAAGLGACLINDISGGTLDPAMLPAVAKLQLPYVFSHILGSPETMQQNPQYQNVVSDLMHYFSKGLRDLGERGIFDVIIDPGFGFGKTVDQNYSLLQHLEEFQFFQRPLLVGLSRKSMIQKALKTDASGSLNGTTVLNTIALQKGADILRVHDPREAREAILLTDKLKTT